MNMNKIQTLLMIALIAFPMMGCSKAFWAGTGAGVAGTGAGYEIRAHQQLKQLQEDRDAGKISDEEYRIRKDQIEKGSVFQ